MKLEDTEEEIYHAVGKGICRFSIIEMRLCLLFCELLSPGKIQNSSKVFWSIISFEAKVNVINSIAEQELKNHPKILLEWSKIYKVIRKAATNRNKLAHGAAISINGIYVFAPYPSNAIQKIINKESDDESINLTSKEVITVKQINDIIQGFSSIFTRISNMHIQLLKIERNKERKFHIDIGNDESAD